MFVLGTAGHIDHGKSTLIKQLTGIDPDRLPEESQRGMTIDLGFAWMDLPNGDKVGIVDVPGHERFVRNMVAGAGGINAAMLVIAANDGWMPQTQEHFDILRLLDIQHGFVALTKIDLVEPDWIELVSADIQAKLKGTFLEKAPIVPVSGTTGAGLDNIRSAISDLSDKIRNVEDIGKARLFIDRAFVLTGIGVVVTGTSRGGGFDRDREVFHFPGGEKSKIRSLQAHDKDVASVGPGSRVAINLSGLARDEIKRGHALSDFAFEISPQFIAANIATLPNSPISLKEGRHVLFILGTTETEASIRPFDDRGIAPGHSGLAIIKIDLPVAAMIGDNFILRLPTPQVTIGGGQVLDILDSYPRRRALKNIQAYITKRVNGDLDDIILSELEKSKICLEISLLRYSNFSSAVISEAVERLAGRELIYRHKQYLFDKEYVDKSAHSLIEILNKTHRNKSYLNGLTAETLMRRVKAIDIDSFNRLIDLLIDRNLLARKNQFIHLPGFQPTLDEGMENQADQLIAILQKAGHNYLTFDDIEESLGNSRPTINFLKDQGSLVTIGSNLIVLTETWKEILEFIRLRLDSEGRIALAEYRDKFGNSRKFALPILEYLDQMGITRRDGEYRVKGAHFDERSSL